MAKEWKDPITEEYLMKRRASARITGAAIAVVIYAAGLALYGFSHILPSKESILLHANKIEATKKVDELQRFIPLMQESFQVQYKDSLEQAVKDTARINSDISRLFEEKSKKPSMFYSWLGFLID